MTTIFHKGEPCFPPIVNGVTFTDREDGIWTGDVPEGQEELFLGVPAFTLEDPAAKAPAAPKGKGKGKAPAGDPPAGDGQPEGDGEPKN